MIHINTELRVAWRTGLPEALKRNSDAVAPYKLLPDVVRGVKTVVRRRLELFGVDSAAPGTRQRGSPRRNARLLTS